MLIGDLEIWWLSVNPWRLLVCTCGLREPPKSPAHVAAATANSHEPELEDEESLEKDTGVEGKE